MMKKFKIITTFYNPETKKHMQPGETIEVDGEQRMTLLIAGVIGEEVKDDADDTGPSEESAGDSSGKHTARRNTKARASGSK